MIGYQWIRADQLLSLGLTREQLAFFFIFIGVLVIYYIVQPLVYWFVTLQSTKMLSYVIASLLVVIAILVISNKASGETAIRLPKITLQTLAAFGGGLLAVRIIALLVRKTLKKSV